MRFQRMMYRRIQKSGNGLSKVAAVFDGDYIYIYMKEKSENASDGAAGSSGSYAEWKIRDKD